MSIELIVPTLGESITEATVSKWLKKVGESFEADEPLVEIETDKITVEVPAPSAGTLSEIKVQEGKDISIGSVLGIINDSNKENNTNKQKSEKVSAIKEKKEVKSNLMEKKFQNNEKLSPSVKKLLEENNLSANKIKSSPRAVGGACSNN